MSGFARLWSLLAAWLAALFRGAEDPRAALEYSYDRQVEILRDVKRGVIDATGAQRRLKVQAALLRDRVARMDDEARSALQSGREDLARLALERKQVARLQLDDLEGQVGSLERERDQLDALQQRLETKVQAFRSRKTLINAQHTAAEAQVRLGEAFTGLSDELGNVTRALDRLQSDTRAMQARAAAIEELVQLGVLEDSTAGADLRREIPPVSLRQEVDADLRRLRADA